MKKLIYILVSAALLVSTISCQKPDILEKELSDQIEVTKTMDDLVVGSEFDWKTTKDIQVKLDVGANGTVYINSPEGDTFQKAFIRKNDEYLSKITVPTYVDEIQLVYAGRTEVVPIVNNKLEFTF